MNAFVFKPSNEFIGKFEITATDELPEKLQAFLSLHPSVRPYSYVEVRGQSWTLAALNPFQLKEGRVSPDGVTNVNQAGDNSMRHTQPGDANSESEAPPKKSVLARCAIWSGTLTIGVPLLWVVLVEGLGVTGHGNAALGLGWFGVLAIIIGVPIGTLVTLGLTIAAVVESKKRKDAAKAAQATTNNPNE